MESGETRTLGRNAFSAAFFGAMGAGCTVVVDALVLALFGLGWTTDAYFVASTLPLVLGTTLVLLASTVVQPLFIHARNQEGERPGWLVLNLIITTTTVIVFFVATIGALSSPLLMRAQAPGLDTPAMVLATHLS